MIVPFACEFGKRQRYGWARYSGCFHHPLVSVSVWYLWAQGRERLPCAGLRMRSWPKGPKPASRRGLGAHPRAGVMSSGSQWGSHGVSHHFCSPPGADAAAPGGSFSVLCSSMPVSPVEGDPAGGEPAPWSRTSDPTLVWEGTAWSCLRVSSGPAQQLWVGGCEGRAGLKVLSLVNIAAAVVDGHTVDPPLVCRALLLSQKDDGRCSCFFPKQHSSRLISSFSFFPHPISFCACGAHQDTCQIFAESGLWFVYCLLRTHLLTINFCVDSGTCFFNLLRIAVSFSDVFATIALWLWNEVQRTLVGRR